jgi:hypothetical protein
LLRQLDEVRAAVDTEQLDGRRVVEATPLEDVLDGREPDHVRLRGRVIEGNERGSVRLTVMHWWFIDQSYLFILHFLGLERLERVRHVNQVAIRASTTPHPFETNSHLLSE